MPKLTKRPTAKMMAKPSEQDYAKAAARVMVKALPKKPQNARQVKLKASEVTRLAVLKQAAADAKDPIAAKKRKAKEAKDIDRFEAVVQGKKVDRAEFVQKHADEICERLAEGEHLKPILKAMDIKFVDMCHWLKINKAFREAYDVAHQNSVRLFISEVVDIADSTGRGGEKVSDLKIKVRQWLASKILSKTYGDRVTHSGDADNPVVTKLVSDSDELLKKLRG